MKSSINVDINVYAPKAERNRAPHLNRAKRTVKPLGSNFKVLQLQLSRADAFTRSREALNSAVRSSVKRLNSVMNK